MKKFILYITKLTVAIFAMLFVLNYLFDFLHLNTRYPTNKIQSIGLNKNKHFDYIFLGSSRVLYGINESHIKKNVFQLGIQGQTFQETVLTLKLLTENNVTADTIFFQLDGDSGIETITTLGSYVFLPFSNKHEVIQDHFYKNGYSKGYLKMPFFKYMKNAHKIGYRQILNSYFLSNRNTLGYTPLHDKSDYFIPYEFTHEKLISKEKITELKDYCNQHDISIVFLQLLITKQSNMNCFSPLFKSLMLQIIWTVSPKKSSLETPIISMMTESLYLLKCLSEILIYNSNFHLLISKDSP